MSFWTDGKIEPKRQNRWIVQFDGIHRGNMYFATKVGRPEIEVSSKEHKYLNHTFNYPGRATWKPVSLTMVDVAGSGDNGEAAADNAMFNLLTILRNSGYIVPSNAGEGGDNQLGTIAKNKAATSLAGGDPATGAAANGVQIKMVDANGLVIEQWNLKNAFITSFKPSELSYEGEDLATVDITITYDYCEYGTDDTNVTLFTPGT
jgi:hypothetical protein